MYTCLHGFAAVADDRPLLLCTSGATTSPPRPWARVMLKLGQEFGLSLLLNFMLELLLNLPIYVEVEYYVEFKVVEVDFAVQV